MDEKGITMGNGVTAIPFELSEIFDSFPFSDSLMSNHLVFFRDNPQIQQISPDGTGVNINIVITDSDDKQTTLTQAAVIYNVVVDGKVFTYGDGTTEEMHPYSYIYITVNPSTNSETIGSVFINTNIIQEFGEGTQAGIGVMNTELRNYLSAYPNLQLPVDGALIAGLVDPNGHMVGIATQRPDTSYAMVRLEQQTETVVSAKPAGASANLRMEPTTTATIANTLSSGQSVEVLSTPIGIRPDKVNELQARFDQENKGYELIQLTEGSYAGMWAVEMNDGVWLVFADGSFGREDVLAVETTTDSKEAPTMRRISASGESVPWRYSTNIRDAIEDKIFEPGIYRTEFFNEIRIVGTVDNVYSSGTAADGSPIWYADLKINNGQTIKLMLGPDYWHIATDDYYVGIGGQTTKDVDGTVNTYYTADVREYLAQHVGMPISIDYSSDFNEMDDGLKNNPACNALCQERLAALESSQTPQIVSDTLALSPGSQNMGNYNGAVVFPGRQGIPNIFSQEFPHYQFQ